MVIERKEAGRANKMYLHLALKKDFDFITKLEENIYILVFKLVWVPIYFIIHNSIIFKQIIKYTFFMC